MAETSTRAVTVLRGNVASLESITATQEERIVALTMRISDLTDELGHLKHDLLKLREDVGEDLKVLFDRTN